jgi:hypothetical protein
MADPRPPKSGLITGVIAASLLAGTAVATLVIGMLGGWREDDWGLWLTLKILWGSCAVAVLAAALTRVTIIAWFFRRYFRRADAGAAPPPDPVGGGPRRPTQAPWYKSGKLSFSMTVVLVSLAGATAVAVAVLWILSDVLGKDLFWLLFRIIVAAWWVATITIVLTRVGVFRVGMLRGRQNPPAPPGDGAAVRPPSSEEIKASDP